MKYIKKFEESKNLSEYTDNKFLFIKPNNDGRIYLVEVIEFFDKFIYTKKLYTLKNNLLTKNKHQNYNIDIEKIDSICIYKSKDLKDSYKVLLALNDVDKYNI